jgi:uncharacterized membrane protein
MTANMDREDTAAWAGPRHEEQHHAEQHHEETGKQPNVSDLERWISALGGSFLITCGLGQKGITRLALAALGGGLVYRGVTGHCPLYTALGMDTACGKDRTATVLSKSGIKVEKATTIMRPAHELYQFWRRFENLPHVFRHLESVTVEGNRSHWVVKAPLGLVVEWDAEVINEIENELIAWKSVPEADVDHAGSVHFRPAPGGRGTEVKVVLNYSPPAGKIGAWIAKVFGEDPEHEIEEDLRRFKQVMETGEVPTTKGQPSAREEKDQGDKKAKRRNDARQPEQRDEAAPSESGGTARRETVPS